MTPQDRGNIGYIAVMTTLLAVTMPIIANYSLHAQLPHTHSLDYVAKYHLDALAANCAIVNGGNVPDLSSHFVVFTPPQSNFTIREVVYYEEWERSVNCDAAKLICRCWYLLGSWTVVAPQPSHGFNMTFSSSLALLVMGYVIVAIVAIMWTAIMVMPMETPEAKKETP